jgi:hypothetical protein
MAKGFNEFLKEVEEKLPPLTEKVAEEVGGKGGMVAGIMEGMTNNIVGLVATLLPGIVSIIPDGITAAIDHIKEKYGEGFTKNADMILDLIKDYGLIDDEGAKILNHITKTFGVFQTPMLVVSIVMIVINYMKELMTASTGKIMQGYNSAFSPYALDATSAARAAFIAPEKYDEAYDALRRNGLSDKDITLLYLSINRTQDTETIRELFLRKEYSQLQAQAELMKQGYTPKRIEDLMKTWYPIPGPQDLITMAVREAFDEGQVRELGLDDNPQPAFTEWAEKQGISPYWSKMYWRSHWQLPSPQMGYEMLHRGQITEDQLLSLLTALDYSPRWHKALMGISYNVMTRVDVRRIFELGLINPQELEEAYSHMGYSPADSKLLRAWTEIEYNQEYKDITKTEVIKQYLEGIIEESQLTEMLHFMGYTSERIDTMVSLASYQRAFAKQSTRVAALRKLYISGDYSLAQVQQELAPFNIDPRRILEIVDQWELERKAGITPPKKAELDRWYMEDIVNGTEYVEEMQKIGYSEKNIARYARSIQLAKEKV